MEENIIVITIEAELEKGPSGCGTLLAPEVDVDGTMCCVAYYSTCGGWFGGGVPKKIGLYITPFQSNSIKSLTPRTPRLTLTPKSWKQVNRRLVDHTNASPYHQRVHKNALGSCEFADAST